MNWGLVLTPDGRRALAFFAILGGCIVMTIFAAVAVYLVSGNELYSLILGLAANFQILVGMTAIGWVLGRRMRLEANKDGATISDGGSENA